MPDNSRRRLLPSLGLLAALAATSIPLGLLQFGVWAYMFDKFYEETQSIHLSALWTLDGSHRCSGCELVERLGADASETVSQPRALSLENHLLLDEETPFLISQGFFLDKLRFGVQAPLARADLVETPPPQA